MNIEQIALVVKEAIREAARQFDVLPSQAFNPNNNNKKEIKARDMAIRLAFDQGIERKELVEAFRRNVKTIRTALNRTKPN